MCPSSGRPSCCDSPWSSCGAEDDCFDDFFECDGRCVRREWVGDGWPDCLDGADEEHGGGGRVFACVHCAGVVLPAAQLCRSSGRGLTAECVHDFIGQGECNVCVGEYVAP